jgi:capsular exopolysaccharide synthesis family protein
VTPTTNTPEPPDDSVEVFNLDFRRYLKALRRYLLPLLALVALAVAAAVVYTSRQPRIYRAKASIQIEPRIRDLLGQGESGMVSITTTGNDYYKQQRNIVSSYTLVQQTVRDHQLVSKLLTDAERESWSADVQLKEAIKRLQAALAVKGPEQDRTMYIIVRHSNPELAAQIANDHAATFVAYTKGLLTVDTAQASKALTTEFDQAAAKLQESESKLYAFQKDNKVLEVSLQDRQNLVSTNITTFTAKMNEARSRRIELGAKLDRMKKASADELLDSPILMMGDSASFDVLRAQYYTERNAFLQLEKELGPKNPEYQKQKAKVDDLYAALNSEGKRIVGGVQANYETALATEKALALEVRRFEDEAFALGPTVVQYNELLRDKKNWEDKYNILRTRLATSEMTGRMTSESNTTNVKQLDPALVPTTPVSPSLRLNIAFAVAISMLLGIGLVFLSVFLDRTVKTTQDAQQSSGVSVLGFIPMLSSVGDDTKSRDLYVHSHPKSIVAESCRALRTNILFSTADRSSKTLLVSSANQREGKTTSVIYLGTTMAQSGQRVLLIDTDMRRPRLHTSLGVTRQSGISNLILGDQTYEDVIKTTDIPNLFVLPCGPLPPNPAELLMTNRFQTVLAELAARFDRVILDSPPVQAVTDAVVLSKLVDGVILVVRADKTLREDLRRSAKQMHDVGGPLFGVIVNEVNTSDRAYYSYGYGYEYGYSAQEAERTAEA